MCGALVVRANGQCLESGGCMFSACTCSSWLPLKFGDCLIACSVTAGISTGIIPIDPCMCAPSVRELVAPLLAVWMYYL